MSCILCDYNSLRVLYSQYSFQYGICNRCTHIQQLYVKPQSFYNDLPYESQWDNYQEHANNRADYIYDFIRPYISKYSLFGLDIGCSHGGVTKALYRKISADFKRFDGVTLDDVSDIKVDWNGKLYQSTFEEFDAPAVYNVMIMSHVLEHAVDPIKMLRTAASHMMADGIIYIEVPSFYWAEMRSDPMFCPVHISYFTKDILTNLLTNSGFKILKMHESKYWGNIKIVAQFKERYILDISKKSSVVKIYRWKYLKHLVYWYYKLIAKSKNLLPND